MKTTLHRLIPLFVLCSMVHAATISYTDSGTFTAATPTAPFSGPSEAWAFAFQADSNPTVLESDAGSFDFAFSNFSYSLNNSPVAIVPTFIRFGSSPNGGWLMCLNGTPTNCLAGLSTLGAGPQMYTGTTSAPTLIPGAFTSTTFDFFLNHTLLFTQPNTTVLAVVVPEPSTLLMLAGGLLVFGGTFVSAWVGLSRASPPSSPGVPGKGFLKLVHWPLYTLNDANRSPFPSPRRDVGNRSH